MCLYPRLIQNKKYTSTKKNGGVIPAITDKRTMLVPVGCGKCMECMKKKARNWQVRLLEETKVNNNGLFVTLTFSNESITELSKEINGKLDGYDRDNAIAKIAVRRFLERWRKENKKSVKHWLITELGHEGTENIHLHGIIWTDKSEEYVKEKWKYGFIWTNERKGGKVGEQVVNYIIKYCTKIDEKHKEYKPIILCSPGIGKNYINSTNAGINKFKKGKTEEYYKTRTGHKINLPIYYRNKIYSEEEREKLWLQKLDEEKRFVDGVEISVKDGTDTYYKVLEEARKKNKRLGYQDDTIDWERREYERNLRNLKFKERTKPKEETAEEQIKNMKYKEPE